MTTVATILNAPKADLWRKLAAAGYHFESAIKEAPDRIHEIQEAYLAFCAEENARQAAEQAQAAAAQRRVEIAAHIERQQAQGLEWAYGDDLSLFTEDRDQWQPKGTRARRALSDEWDRRRPDGGPDAPAVQQWARDREVALAALG